MYYVYCTKTGIKLGFVYAKTKKEASEKVKEKRGMEQRPFRLKVAFTFK